MYGPRCGENIGVARSPWRFFSPISRGKEAPFWSRRCPRSSSVPAEELGPGTRGRVHEQPLIPGRRSPSGPSLRASTAEKVSSFLSRSLELTSSALGLAAEFLARSRLAR